MPQDEVRDLQLVMNVDPRDRDGLVRNKRERVVARGGGVDDLLHLILSKAERADVDVILPLMEIADRLVARIKVEHKHVPAAQACERIAGRAHDDVMARGADDLIAAFDRHADMSGRREAGRVAQRVGELVADGLTSRRRREAAGRRIGYVASSDFDLPERVRTVDRADRRTVAKDELVGVGVKLGQPVSGDGQSAAGVYQGGVDGNIRKTRGQRLIGAYQRVAVPIVGDKRTECGIHPAS